MVKRSKKLIIANYDKAKGNKKRKTNIMVIYDSKNKKYIK
jgi:hypothetical protein